MQCINYKLDIEDKLVSKQTFAGGAFFKFAIRDSVGGSGCVDSIMADIIVPNKLLLCKEDGVVCEMHSDVLFRKMKDSFYSDRRIRYCLLGFGRNIHTYDARKQLIELPLNFFGSGKLTACFVDSYSTEDGWHPAVDVGNDILVFI